MAALETIATLRPQVDAFFDAVMVMAPDAAGAGEPAGTAGAGAWGFFRDCGLFGDCGGGVGRQGIPQGLKRLVKKSPRGEKTYLSG